MSGQVSMLGSPITTVAIDADGRRPLSRRVANDKPELLALIDDVVGLSDEVTWAVDLPDGGAALLIGLLATHDQALLYIPWSHCQPRGQQLPRRGQA